jgi:hypothetical protein
MLKGNQTSGNLTDGLEIGTLDASEVGEALGIVSRGMRDNPLIVAAFGADPDLRLRRFRRFVGAGFAVMGWHRHMLAARDDGGAIVGVVGMRVPGTCLPNPLQRLRILTRLLPNGPRDATRTARWLGAWAEHDPGERHWHVGPVAVDACL